MNNAAIASNSAAFAWKLWASSIRASLSASLPGPPSGNQFAPTGPAPGPPRPGPPAEHARQRARRDVLRRPAVGLVENLQHRADEVRADRVGAAQDDAVDVGAHARGVLREGAQRVDARVADDRVRVLEPARDRRHRAREMRERELALGVEENLEEAEDLLVMGEEGARDDECGRGRGGRWSGGGTGGTQGPRARARGGRRRPRSGAVVNIGTSKI